MHYPSHPIPSHIIIILIFCKNYILSSTKNISPTTRHFLKSQLFSLLLLNLQQKCLWSSAQIQGSGFDSRGYQIYWEVVGLERGVLSLMSTIEELLGRKSSGSGLESRDYGSRYKSRWPSGTFYLQKLTLTSPTGGGRSVCIVRPRTQATEFSLVMSCHVGLNTK
jgi:hypothetical protein